jgi:hypothetical protein
VVVVAAQDDVGTGLVQRPPEGVDGGDVAVLAGAEARVVPVGEGAFGGMGGKIRP